MLLRFGCGGLAVLRDRERNSIARTQRQGLRYCSVWEGHWGNEATGEQTGLPPWAASPTPLPRALLTLGEGLRSKGPWGAPSRTGWGRPCLLWLEDVFVYLPLFFPPLSSRFLVPSRDGLVLGFSMGQGQSHRGEP